MAVPVSLQQVLDAVSPPAVAEPVEADGSADGQRRIMTVLADDKGRVQVVLLDSQLLDVDRLNKAMTRNFRALNRSEMQQLLSRLRLQMLPAIPKLTGLDTIVDNAIDLSIPGIVATGANGDLIRIDADSYRQLVVRSQSMDVAVPLSRIPVNENDPQLDGEQFRLAIQRFTQLRIKQRLEDTLELPPLPETAQRIIHLRVNPNAEVGDLSDIVESDPSLAAQVVSWASSSFYAAPSPVKSVHDAIMRVLGFELVMNLSMGLALGRTLKQPNDAPEGFLDYWQQAIWMAQAAGLVNGLMPRGHRPAFGLSYLAGLLHNFGYLVLAHVFPPHFTLICRYAEANRHVDTRFVEQYLIGITREQIGSQLMDVWAMPEEVVVALRHQKNPDYDGPHAIYAKILWLARHLLIERGIPLGPRSTLPDGLMEELGLKAGEVAEEFDKLVGSSADIATMADMMSV